MVRSRLYWALLLMMGGCATVPLGRGAQTQTPPSVAPLRPETQFFVLEDQQQQKSGFQLVKSDDKPTASQSPKAARAGLSPEALKARLQEASDKAVSAANLSRLATSQEDWNLAVGQWQRAIALLQGIPNPSAPVRQQLAEYRQQLAQTQQQAQAKLTPKSVKLELSPAELSNGRSGVVMGGDSPKPSPSPKAGKEAQTTPEKNTAAQTPGSTPSEKPAKPQ